MDPFDVADRLVAGFKRFCVIDLEGHRRNRPQLDYLQELSRSGELWVDAGVRTGDQVIDVLVTGARRAVLSTAFLLGPRELKRAWRLSPEILFAVEADGSAVRQRGNDWDNQPVRTAMSGARALGVVDLVLRSGGESVDWDLARQLSGSGQLWVGGGPEAADQAKLASAGVAGGLFNPSRALLTGLSGV